MYYNRDAREKLIKWNVSFLFISDKIQIWNALALFVGKKLGFPPLLKKNILNFTLKYFIVLVAGTVQNPGVFSVAVADLAVSCDVPLTQRQFSLVLCFPFSS